MRSSAPEGHIVPRAKQATPSGNSGTTACPAGGQPISQLNRVPSATTKTTQSPQHKKSSSTNKDTPRSIHTKGSTKPATPQAQQPSKNPPATPNSGQNKQTHSSQSKTYSTGNSRQTSSKSLSKSPPVAKHGTTSAKAAGGKHPSGSSVPQNQENFGEYDDQEWDVGVGHLIIDLDADIAQADKGKMNSSSMNSSMEDKTSLKMKIKRTKPPTKTSEAKHVIVKSDSIPVGGSSLSQGVVSPTTPQHNGSAAMPVSDSVSRTPVVPRNIYKKEKRRIEVNGTVNPSVSTPSRVTPMTNGPSSPAKEPRPSTSNGTVTKKEYPKVSSIISRSPQVAQSSTTPVPPAPPQQNILSSACKTNHTDDASLQSPAKKIKLYEEKRDACVGTSVGTITEPDSLGPCEPGTAVTLEGIVWHETEEGILVLNVTWRGKSYVGTLLDCTKHDWAPPRLCDSPTSDLDSRNQKGRGKRGRTATVLSSTTSATASEVNITETRSGKLRNAGKGRRGGGAAGQRAPTPNPSPSPAKQDANSVKRKNFNKDETDASKNAKRSRFASSRSTPTNISESSSPGPEHLNSQSENDSETVPVHRPASPKLIECPEPNCGKKYTHVNGLKYHQTHAHKEYTSTEDNETKYRKGDTTPSPTPVIENPVDANISNLIKPSAIRPVPKTIPDDEIAASNNENIVENNIPVVNNVTEKPNGTDEEKAHNKATLPTEKPLSASINVKSINSMSDQVQVASPVKIPPDEAHHQHNESVKQHIQKVPIVSTPEKVIDEAPQLHSDLSRKSENSECQSPIGLESTPLSSLTASSIVPEIVSSLEQKIPQKEDLNGVCTKKEEDISLVEARSPAYSDISEANDTAPSIEDLDTKDFKDDKKIDHSLAGPSQYTYGLYFNSYGQPSPQYMMSMQPPSPSMLKSVEPSDMKDKDRKDIPQGNSDYMKIPPHYLYQYSQLYPSSYQNPYVRDNMYSDDEKMKVEMKECPMEDTEKGPTDLSRSFNHPSSSRAVGQAEKSPMALKDIKAEGCVVKDVEPKISHLDKKHPSDINFRYGGPYDNRGSLLPSPHSSSTIPSVSNPHYQGTVSPAGNKDDKCDKRQDVKPEGVKPTMETTGPPPPPTTSAYYPPFHYPHVPFDPYRQPIMPSLGLATGFPSYNIPGHPSLGGMRYPMLSSGPEDLSRNTLPPALYANAHKFSELQDRIQKSSIQSSGLPCSLTKSNSPMSYVSKEAHMHHAALLSTSSPSLPISSNVPITSIAQLHPASVDRKLLPHMAIPEVYPYNMIPGGQFPPHFPPLGLNPAVAGLGIPPAMTTAQLPK